MPDRSPSEEGDSGLKSWAPPRSGRDEALTLVAADLCREQHLPSLARAVTVSWNPRMRTAAGRAYIKTWLIELNPRLQDLPDQQRETELRNTFLHELAHLVASARAGKRRIQPHGPEWRQACVDLGIPDEGRCHSLDFQPRRLAKKFAYSCPHCGSVIQRVRQIRRRVACYTCCRDYAGGQFDERFRLKESRLA